MAREIPEKLLDFLTNGVKQIFDGYEYSSELNRILNHLECKESLNDREIEVLRDFAEKVKKIDDYDYYFDKRLKGIEEEFFGVRGILGFLGIKINSTMPNHFKF